MGWRVASSPGITPRQELEVGMAVERYVAKYRPIAKEETSTSIRIVPANELLNRDLNPRDVVLFRY